ncbi:hypothetical protein DFH27DRAFT_80183 [Peziza echinospora]|nr:hypothetical protein DFH27DRAFT_80183 [Peziza echinospora]
MADREDAWRGRAHREESGREEEEGEVKRTGKSLKEVSPRRAQATSLRLACVRACVRMCVRVLLAGRCLRWVDGCRFRCCPAVPVCGGTQALLCVRAAVGQGPQHQGAASSRSSPIMGPAPGRKCTTPSGGGAEWLNPRAGTGADEKEIPEPHRYHRHHPPHIRSLYRPPYLPQSRSRDAAGLKPTRCHQSSFHLAVAHQFPLDNGQQQAAL